MACWKVLAVIALVGVLAAIMAGEYVPIPDDVDMLSLFVI